MARRTAKQHWTEHEDQYSPRVRRFNDSQRQVVVRGNIGEITAGPYRMAYRLPLREGYQTVYLDVERELLSRNRIEQGDYVEVTGILTVDEGQNQSSRVDIRVNVNRIEHVNRPQEFERKERASLEYLKNLKPALTQLPEIGSIVISLIHPVSERARVQDDFQKQLGPVGYLVQLESIPVAMNKPEEIAQSQGKCGRSHSRRRRSGKLRCLRPEACNRSVDRPRTLTNFSDSAMKESIWRRLGNPG